MPASASKNDTTKHILLRLGQAVHQFRTARFPEPYESKVETPPQELLKRIQKDTSLVHGFLGLHADFAALRKALGPRRASIGAAHIQVIALVAAHDFVITREYAPSPDSLAHQLAHLICENDPVAGNLKARGVVASLLERGTLIMSDRCVHLCHSLQTWFAGRNPLCLPNLHEMALQSHLRKRKASREATRQEKQRAPPITGPSDIYNRLREVVVGQDEACKVLAVRGWLHLKRAEMLKAGQNVGANECILMISEASGVGKTWLAENYGKICSLPFTSFDSTSATAQGFVGADMVSDSLKSLIRAAGPPSDPASIEKARLGVLFFDEITKKRALAGIDSWHICSRGVQCELLKMMEGSKIQIGSRRIERDFLDTEFNTTGMMFIFGGYVDGFDEITAKLSRMQNRLGFCEGSAGAKRRDAYLYDAMVEYGLIPELVNRLSKIVLFRKLTATDLVEIVSSPAGVLSCYNRLLASQGLTVGIDPQGLRLMAGVAVETGMMARGLRLFLSALVEDAVFSGAKGKIVFGPGEVQRAIEQVTIG